MSPELLAFGAAFALVFALELPDKTMVATLVLTTRYPAWPVLAGVAVAFATHVTIAVLFGSALAALPERLLAAAVALLLALGAYLLLREGFARTDTGPEDASVQGPRRVSFLRAAATSFGVLFAAELGDASQLATAGLTARFGAPVAIALGAFAAMLTVAALAIALGRKLRSRIRPRLLQRISGFAFAGFALLAAAQTFA
jgi:putative Ca2+/H+ antiporter (TMEM165/GDT1 family)